MDFRRSLAQFIILVVCFTFALVAKAALELPRNLNSDDRKAALEILGLSSSGKILSRPFPLGGYQGVELAFSQEFIPTSDLAKLGATAPETSQTNYSLISIGKGLYNNLDVYFQLSPLTGQGGVSNFGGQLRWGAFESDDFPAFLTFVLTANSVSFQNKINTTSIVYDAVAGFVLNRFTLYSGFGFVHTTGTFVGGADGVTAPEGVETVGSTKTESITESHFVAGLHVQLKYFFVTLQTDRYTESTYAFRLGTRF